MYWLIILYIVINLWFTVILQDFGMIKPVTANKQTYKQKTYFVLEISDKFI